MKPNGIAGLAGLLGRDTNSNASHWRLRADSQAKVKGAICLENSKTREQAYVAPVANQNKQS